MPNYLTIKQFATIKGISSQAVYKQINGKLNQYIVKVDGKTFLDYDRLVADESAEKVADKKPTKTINQGTVTNKLNNEVVELLKDQITELKADRDRWYNAFQDLNDRWKSEQEQLKIESVKLLQTTNATNVQPKGLFSKLFSKKEDSSSDQ